VSAADLSKEMIYYYLIPNGGYAPNGNILAHSDMIMGDWIFAYDAADRLISEVPESTAPSRCIGKYACWTYDAFGNRTLEAFSTVACNGTNPTPQMKAVINVANNRITSVSGTTSATFVYDSSGDTLYDGNNEYWYDAEGRLCAVQQVSTTANPNPAFIQYAYDAEGARVAKGTLSTGPAKYALISAGLASSPTCAPPLGASPASGFTRTCQYLLGPGGDQVTELNGSGTWQHSNIWVGGKLIATSDTNGLHFELTDPLGTKRVQANASGQVDETCTGLPFGNDVGNPLGVPCTQVANSLGTEDGSTEHHFTSKERDTESGNDYFGARYYASNMGRFMSPHWSAQEEPVPYANLDNPQSLNLYAYVGNNRLIRFDSDGHCWP
jgi:RHS repeat-associated protein